MVQRNMRIMKAERRMFRDFRRLSSNVLIRAMATGLHLSNCRLRDGVRSSRSGRIFLPPSASELVQGRQNEYKRGIIMR